MSEHRPRVRLETDVLPATRLAGVGLAVIAFSVLLIGVAALLLASARRDFHYVPSPPEPAAAPERLAGVFQSPLPGGAGLAVRREREEVLGHFAWFDRDRGLVRLPIDVAVERLLAGATPLGVPVAPTPEPPPGPATGTDPRGELGRRRGGFVNGP